MQKVGENSYLIMMFRAMKNLFCNSSDLTNEADVEALFVEKLLKSLDYPDDRILRKDSIDQVVIGKGIKREKYKPDYILKNSSDEPIIVIDAKSPNEEPESYHYQVSSYALSLNQRYPGKNPVRYISVTNGYLFIVWPWDSDIPIFYMKFDDFQKQNEKFLELRANLSYLTFKQTGVTKDIFQFERPELSFLIRTFNQLHNLIRKKETLSPSDAFYEFAKLMFIKIREDNKIHNLIESGKKPIKADFIFSTHWIDSQVKFEPNPVDSILFRQIQDDLEKQILEKKKKRIFEKDERLILKATTVYEIVKNLQNFDLYGIDEDLNGRMFETFLNATVRGKDLGQFFTPRGIVHYMVQCAPVKLAHNNANDISKNIPYILDGCCGSGGFLIDAMAELTKKILAMTQLTDKQKDEYLKEVQKNHLFGIDDNNKISRISRLNMYLHGDGGSKIFKANSLNKNLPLDPGMGYEEREGVIELKKYLEEDKLKFDVVITNPPFSINYKAKDDDDRIILEQYELAKSKSGALSTSQKSNVLFMERYKDLLKPESGELLTIIDDTVLNGEAQKYRDFILNNFIIIQVVSLPFNAFFRADANIKTSMLHLRRKITGEKQGNIFMVITNNIGHDDHSRDTPALNNLPEVIPLFNKWRATGELKVYIRYNQNIDEPLSCPLQVFQIKPEEINKSRLDAFYYAPELKQMRATMRALERDNKLHLRKGNDFNIVPEITEAKKEFAGKIFKYFEIGDVTIDGTIIKYREDLFENLPTRGRLLVKENDVVFAKNNSSRGTTVLIPNWFNGGLVTTGFVGIRPDSYEDALILWSMLESDFFRKQVYYLAVTASQPEVRETIFKEEMLIPWPVNKTQASKVKEYAKVVDEKRQSFRTALNEYKNALQKLFPGI